VFREVWEGDFAGLSTGIPLVDLSGHTCGRVHFKFVGNNSEVVRYQELMEAVFSFHIKSARLDKPKEELDLPPEEWDARCKLTTYPGSGKGTTHVLEDCQRNPEWNETLPVPYVRIYFLCWRSTGGIVGTVQCSGYDALTPPLFVLCRLTLLRGRCGNQVRA